MKKRAEQLRFSSEDEQLAPGPAPYQPSEEEERQRLRDTYGEEAGHAPLSNEDRETEKNMIKKMIARTKEMLAQKAKEPFQK